VGAMRAQGTTAAAATAVGATWHTWAHSDEPRHARGRPGERDAPCAACWARLESWGRTPSLRRRPCLCVCGTERTARSTALAQAFAPHLASDGRHKRHDAAWAQHEATSTHVPRRSGRRRHARPVQRQPAAARRELRVRHRRRRRVRPRLRRCRARRQLRRWAHAVLSLHRPREVDGVRGARSRRCEPDAHEWHESADTRRRRRGRAREAPAQSTRTLPRCAAAWRCTLAHARQATARYRRVRACVTAAAAALASVSTAA